jgi:uncharacterized damage-inducible protein DinB
MSVRTRVLALLGAALLAAPALQAGDAPATATAPPKAAAPAFNAFNRMAWGFTKMNLLKSAEKMPEESYAFKPVDTIRSFGQIVGHAADSSMYFCSVVLGEKNPGRGFEKSKTTKADLVAGLKEAIAYCDKAYDTLTPAQGAEMVTLFGGGRELQKVDALTANCMHGVEHYGNMIVYLRMKGLVPPSTEQMEAAAPKPQK